MDETIQQNKYIQMTTSPVNRLVCKLAVPSIISMLVSALYNMADTFFVGRISTEATAAIGIVFSYMLFVQAIAFFFGQGSGNYISLALGRKDFEKAERMASNGVFYSLILGTALSLFCFVQMNPILRMLGATETILPDARSYFQYILIVSPFMSASLVINNQLRLQGNARLGMIGIASGAILNILLDPVFIFGLNLGIKGAALATSISQFVGFIVMLVIYYQKGGVKIRWSSVSFSTDQFAEIVAGGLPSLCRQGMASIAAIFLNQAAGLYGDSAIAAFSIVSRVTMMIYSALLGFGQGFQPVCGFNYGAGLYERVREAFWFCVRISTIVLTVIAIFTYLFSENIVLLFRGNDQALTEIAVKVLRLQSLAIPLLGFVVLTNMYLQNTRKTVRATILAISRQGILFLPILFLFSRFMGLEGICLTQTVCDILTFLLSIPFGLTALGEFKDKKMIDK